MSATETPTPFNEMGLEPCVAKSLETIGYEHPTPIQAACIPLILDGHDIIGQAQTGTGKTAAFALPFLSKLDISKAQPQMLVLAPTRELAIQVAEAMQKYARFMKGFHVTPIYGGQSYDIQLRHLRRGVHVVVGTPGRVMDHIRRKSLDLSFVKNVVLDEADEMLRMGFIEDVEWILGHTPEERQTALFSATMPPAIRNVAKTYMQTPKQISIKSKATTADTIRQRFWQTPHAQKFDALTRLLEFENFDGMLIFVRTKTATLELSEKLEARGFASEALNGDIPQKMRERTIERLKNGNVDIIIATDVAARGLDVERVSHVINYDIPYDCESYVHRIGRTGRAGKSGDAILFVTPREKYMLRTIEKHTRKQISPLDMPSITDINEQRSTRFKESVVTSLTNGIDTEYLQLVDQIKDEHNLTSDDIASALIQIIHAEEPLFLPEPPPQSRKSNKHQKTEEPPKNKREKQQKAIRKKDKPMDNGGTPIPLKEYPEIEMERFRLEVGYNHGVKPKNIVGAIANEAEIESCYIGHIEIYDDFSTIDLPSGMPKQTFNDLKKTRICGHKAQIKRF